MNDLSEIMQRLAIFMPIFILSLSAHEFAHAWSAFRLGDDTAARMGRLTLNPKVHIDLIGTIIIPIVGVFAPGLPLIGWANPVPVNPLRFSRRVTMGGGMAITAAAGPIMNLVLALLFTILLMLTQVICISAGGSSICGESFLGKFAINFFSFGVQINVVLAFFNLIPIPPLDGSRIMRYVLPHQHKAAYDQLQPYSMFILIGLMVSGVLGVLLYPAYLTIDLLDWIRITLGNALLGA